MGFSLSDLDPTKAIKTLNRSRKRLTSAFGKGVKSLAKGLGTIFDKAFKEVKRFVTSDLGKFVIVAAVVVAGGMAIAAAQSAAVAPTALATTAETAAAGGTALAEGGTAAAAATAPVAAAPAAAVPAMAAPVSAAAPAAGVPMAVPGAEALAQPLAETIAPAVTETIAPAAANVATPTIADTAVKTAIPRVMEAGGGVEGLLASLDTTDKMIGLMASGQIISALTAEDPENQALELEKWKRRNSSAFGIKGDDSGAPIGSYATLRDDPKRGYKSGLPSNREGLLTQMRDTTVKG